MILGAIEHNGGFRGMPRSRARGKGFLTAASGRSSARKFAAGQDDSANNPGKGCAELACRGQSESQVFVKTFEAKAIIRVSSRLAPQLLPFKQQKVLL